jgi:hypothetical protein
MVSQGNGLYIQTQGNGAASCQLKYFQEVKTIRTAEAEKDNMEFFARGRPCIPTITLYCVYREKAKHRIMFPFELITV